MAKTLLKIFAVVVLLLFCVADYPDYRVAERAQSTTSQDVELAEGWELTEADDRAGAAENISSAGYDTTDWTPVPRMPGTVLQILQDAGVYQNLYFGTNLLTEVPQDLYRKDWWYRTTFTAPAGLQTYLLDFPGINYRAEIWLNGHQVADRRQVVGMYADHEIDVTPWIAAGEQNTLAVRVTPERAIQDVDGVELADSWYDWINWRYLGYQSPDGTRGASFVADRNAGVWKPVHLKAFGPVGIGSAVVNTELPLPATDRARLTVYAGLHNHSAAPVRGVLTATITRTGKDPIRISQPVSIQPGEDREIVFTPDEFGQLSLRNPDLWWPYTMGRPDLYDLKLDFVQNRIATASSSLKFGIRTVSQGRADNAGAGGDFYLRVNGRDFPVRGATYTPDLLYKYDPDRDAAILRYTKDLGLNMLRLESKIASSSLVGMADKMGIPLMYGWMCCNQWERWQQWDTEDHRVAAASLRAQITMLRSHASVFIWANGSDGRPPEDVRKSYHRILGDLHWQNPVVDTVSTLARDRAGAGAGNEELWDGIQMNGPYSWRPPSYWFAGTYPATRGSTAEQGDNEHIPPFASLRRFIPPDKLWPINETWYFHAGADTQNSTLTNIRTAIDLRYGQSPNAQTFADKAQLAHYENTRAQFEAFAAGGFERNKMTIYWMLNSHWPSFFGNLFDYYLRPGGAYYGAKKGLRPLSVVFDSYATGDHRQAKVTVVNQSPDRRTDLRVRVRVYDLLGQVRSDRTADRIEVGPGGTAPAMTLPPGPADSPVFFVRCELLDDDGGTVTDNVYWQSQQIDDVGPAFNDAAFESRQFSWADMTALNTMAKPTLDVTARAQGSDGAVTITLRNPSQQIGFFERAEILATRDGDEILPIEYDDNYVTVFPGETVDIHAHVPAGSPLPEWVRVTGYGGAPTIAPIR
ncbi:MAG: glycoside hydrolase [Mycobacterium sp.]|nr:glycoside hydrolase [Mycobacterium sp.]